MNADRWRQIDGLLQAALELDPAQRSSFLDVSCSEDPDLRREVESLLEFHDRGADFLETPPSETAEDLLKHLKSGRLENQTIGHYQIVEAIGAGGMGEVYRARDLELGREVALKFLPLEFSANSARLNQFRTEARAASVLNHPNIVTIHEVGHVGPIHYIVMELVPGNTLRRRLAQGTVPLPEALEVAIQVAQGLACAHEAGITHSDLKPENIMIGKDGLVKILDFGLARAQPAKQEEATDSPHPRRKGIHGGTAGYMAPEQARKSAFNYTADQFAFGAILYELLTGERAFRGASVEETLSSIIEGEPRPAGALRPSIPTPLRWIVERCLSKDPDGRYASTVDLVRDLKWAESHLSDMVPRPVEPAATGRKSRIAWIAASFSLVIAAAAVAGYFFRPVPGSTHPVRFLIPPVDQSGFETTGILSPDGRRLVFARSATGSTGRLWLRELNSPEARPLPKTENARFPFWSADGHSIGFFADGSLKTVDLSGSVPRVVCAAADGRGGAWSPDGTILFSPGTRTPLFRVSAAGGNPVAVTVLDEQSQEIAHRWPVFLPGGREFLYLSMSEPTEERSILLGSLESGREEVLVRGAIAPQFAPPDRLYFVKDGELFVQRFNPGKMRLDGAPSSVISGISSVSTRGDASYSVSGNGHLTYLPAPDLTTQLVWFDRTGKEMGPVGPAAQYRCPEISPAGDLVAVEALDRRRHSYDIWLVDLRAGTAKKLLDDPSDVSNASWSPDGENIAFSTNRHGQRDIYVRSVISSSERLLSQHAGEKSVDHWSPDGKSIVYTSYTKDTLNDLWILPINGNGKPVPILNTPASEVQGRISPNMNWLAYVSDQSGTREVYLQPFPGGGRGRKVSHDGGGQPVWRQDGKELFYMSANRKLMSVEVRAAETLSLGSPKLLFQTRITGLMNARNHYTVTRDGQRFLVNTPIEDPAMRPITVVLNWNSN